MGDEGGCISAAEADSWVYECQVTMQTDLLNPAYICDRADGHKAAFVILYILISLFAMVSNSSVVLASIVERWKEIDQFTFVSAVSLSFNHFLVAFLVYPMTVYTMLKNNGWGLGQYWCTFTAYCTSYFEVLYMMHVLMILCDMLIYRFTSLKDVVKVFLVKKVAMSLWVTALIPHMLLIWNDKWFLIDGGTLGIKEKYRECGAEDDTVIINCYTAYTFTTYRELYIYLCCFWLIPVSYSVCFYMALLYIRKRSLFKGNHKGVENDLSEEQALEKSRTFIERYKASVCMVVVFSVTQLPKWITSFSLLYQDTQEMDAQTEDPSYKMREYGSTMVLGMDFLSFWTCIGSVMIPVCYMMTCPTYFHAVTSTKALSWLRKYGVKIHGRTYSKRLGIGNDSSSPEDVGNGMPLETIPEPVTVICNESCHETASNGVHVNGASSPGEPRPLSPTAVAILVTPVDKAARRRSQVSPDNVFVNETINPSSSDVENTPRNSVLTLEEKIQVKRTLPTPRAPTPTSPLSYHPVTADSPFFSSASPASRHKSPSPVPSSRKIQPT